MYKIRTASKILVLILLFSMLTGFSRYNTRESSDTVVFSMFINHVEVGVVDFPARGLALYDKVIEETMAQYTDPVIVEADIFFRESKNRKTSPKSILCEGIKNAIRLKMEASAIVIDGEALCFLRTDEEANEVLNTIQEPYKKKIAEENGIIEEIYFKEEVIIERQTVLYEKIVYVDEAVDIILKGRGEERYYEVKEGDSFWSIAQAYNMSVSDLQEMNNSVDSETIHPGQVLKLTQVEDLITVVSKEKTVITEEIPFETETRESDSLYKGQSKIVKKGENGQKEVDFYITRENGVEVSREMIEERVIKEPVTQIEEKGTKARPVSKSSGGDYTPISRGGVEMTPWFGGAQNIFSVGSVAKITHVDTGLTFYAKRRGGTNHADCEPLTSQDTEIMRQIYGGSWSWTRKAIIVEVNGRKMAASMNGMPHGQSSINNGFPGHFCIHFYGSKGHGNPKEDPQHQAMVRRAMGM